MTIGISVALFLLLLIIYIVVIEIFTALFRITGLTQEKANFQVISLLTGAGFTTLESEVVMNTKFRRNIAKGAMLFGYMFSVFLAGTIISMLSKMSTNEVNNMYGALGILMAVGAIIYFAIKMKWIKRLLDKWVQSIVEKLYLKKSKKNPYYILESYGKMVICELLVTEVPEKIKGKTIIESKVKEEYGLSYVTIVRKNESIEISPFKDIVKLNDKLVIHGKIGKINKLFRS